jgi:hypothetical protein
MFAWFVRTGAVTSTSVTVTVNVASAVFPCASVAVQSTVVGDGLIGKLEPDAGAQVTGSVPSTLSVAVGLVQLTVLGALTVVVVEMLPGMPLMTGGMLSM